MAVRGKLADSQREHPAGRPPQLFFTVRTQLIKGLQDWRQMAA
jgi:hypothetical protein